MTLSFNSCGLNRNEGQSISAQEQLTIDSTRLADSLSYALIVKIINDDLKIQGKLHFQNNTQYFVLGDSLIPLASIGLTEDYSEANKAIEKFIDDKEVIPVYYNQVYLDDLRKKINYKIDLFDFAFVTIYTTNNEIFQALEDIPSNTTNQSTNNEYTQKIRYKLERGQFILYPKEEYENVLGRVFYIKFGERSNECFNNWYNLLELKYSEITRDSRYKAHIDELNRRFENE